MTPSQLVDLRISLGLTQTGLAALLGMSMRALQDIENGRAALRPVHILAVRYVALDQAVARGDPLLAPEDIRQKALALAALMPA